jgi:hypothetical protein
MEEDEGLCIVRTWIGKKLSVQQKTHVQRYLFSKVGLSVVDQIAYDPVRNVIHGAEVKEQPLVHFHIGGEGGAFKQVWHDARDKCPLMRRE